MTSGWDPVPSPYVELTREDWGGLRDGTPLPLTPGELDALRGLKDPIDITEVEEVYLPLSRLLTLFVRSDGRLRDTVGAFLGGEMPPTPFVIGVAGSVAVGKSTTSRLLRTLLARRPEHPVVELVTTDSFLYPNSVLSERGLMDRKGFPESYDRRALVEFVSAIKSGAEEYAIPVYSHLEYDIVPDATQTVRRPDILIIEGLNVLQPPPGRRRPSACPTSSTSPSTWTPASRTSGSGSSTGCSRCAAPRSPTRAPTSTGTRASWTRTRPPRSPSACGGTSTRSTWSPTSCRPAPAPPSSCTRTATTPSSASASAACDSAVTGPLRSPGGSLRDRSCASAELR